MVFYILAPIMLLLAILFTKVILSEQTANLGERIFVAIAVDLVIFFFLILMSDQITAYNNVLDFLINLTS